MGAVGATGIQGAAGATGAVGPAGQTGAAGAIGAVGAAGTAAAQGVAGATGIQGPAGATGATGAVGANGLNGADGMAGAAGAPGAQGPAGATGMQGVAGATGAMGATGLNGSTGANGAAGVAGAVGATGAPGQPGPTGLAGATGAQGLAGATGPTGATGATGAVGARGAVGLTGVTFRGNYSSTATYSPRDVVLYNGTLYENTSSGSVGNVTPGNGNNIYTVFLPSNTGASGSPGATGPVGVPGSTGPQGSAAPEILVASAQLPTYDGETNTYSYSLSGYSRNSLNFLQTFLPLPNACTTLQFTGTIYGQSAATTESFSLYLAGAKGSPSLTYNPANPPLCGVTADSSGAPQSCTAVLSGPGLGYGDLNGAYAFELQLQVDAGSSGANITTKVACMP